MSRKIIGVILLLVLGSMAIVGVWYLLPYFEDRSMRNTSDADRLKGTIRLALDNWIGYYPLRSREMRSTMHRQGWQLNITDDSADYVQRMNKLRDDEVDFAVATVDSFLLNGYSVDYPATIIAVLDESKGGDSILALADKVKNLSSVKGKDSLRIVFTPNSPSHHLLKAARDHFNLPELLPQGPGRLESEGSEEALKMLVARKADLAVLWEPDVSRALNQPGVVKILGTEDTARLIVDILLVNRRFSEEHPEVVGLFLKTYFKVLKKYRDNPKLLAKEVKEDTGLSSEAVKNMLKGVAWVSLGENCERWFGINASGGMAQEDLVDTIESTADILVGAGDFKKSPIPGNDPYRLINSSFLETLHTWGVSGFSKSAGSKAMQSSLEIRFSALDDADWNSLKDVGVLKVEPIVFQSGSSVLNLLSKKVLDRAVPRLKHYPNFRVRINGHTGTRGSKKENQLLSQERAMAVARYLEITYNVDPNRLRPKGFGGSKPLKRRSGESRRSYEYRLPRVELVLAREDY